MHKVNKARLALVVVEIAALIAVAGVIAALRISTVGPDDPNVAAFWIAGAVVSVALAVAILRENWAYITGARSRQFGRHRRSGP